MWFFIHLVILYTYGLSTYFHLSLFLLYLLYTLIDCVKQCNEINLSSLGLFLIYLGMHVHPSIIDFSFVPWYVVCFYGMRDRYTFIFIGGIVVGTYLWHKPPIQILSHVLLIVGRMTKQKVVPPSHHCIIHLLMFLICYQTKGLNILLTFENIIGVISNLLFFYFEHFDNMDLFCFLSITVFHNPWVFLRGIIIQLLDLEWYLYFKNNHFLPVHNTYTFIIPIGVLLFCLIY
ncbi:MAG: hypothetical protein CMF41_04200 [Legionellales bacterium]|nr:hypothetical protein [Legionellales bacterium]